MVVALSINVVRITPAVMAWNSPIYGNELGMRSTAAAANAPRIPPHAVMVWYERGTLSLFFLNKFDIAKAGKTDSGRAMIMVTPMATRIYFQCMRKSEFPNLSPSKRNIRELDTNSRNFQISEKLCCACWFSFRRPKFPMTIPADMVARIPDTPSNPSATRNVTWARIRLRVSCAPRDFMRGIARENAHPRIIPTATPNPIVSIAPILCSSTDLAPSVIAPPSTTDLKSS